MNRLKIGSEWNSNTLSLIIPIGMKVGHQITENEMSNQCSFPLVLMTAPPSSFTHILR